MGLSTSKQDVAQSEQDTSPTSTDAIRAESNASGGNLKPFLNSHKDTINTGLHPTHHPGKFIALDCEMVGTGPPPHSDHLLARVSIVNYRGEQLYDSYVLPPPDMKVADYRTFVSGIQPHHLHPSSARAFTEVQAEVAALLKGRILVGHALRNDLNVLQLSHDRRDIRDTARYPGFRKLSHGSPALRHLAKAVLGLDIQGGEHSSLEDARATMALFRHERQGFDEEAQKRFGIRGAKGSGSAAKRGGKKAVEGLVGDGGHGSDVEDVSDGEDSEADRADDAGQEGVAKGKKKRKKKKRTKRK